MYNKKVLEHFVNPRNSGTLKNADGIGETGNTTDGDKIRIQIKIKKDIINDIKFQTFGCAAAIAASSMLTVIAKGKKIEEALKITNEGVAEALGGLPKNKLDCSNIAATALHKAIKNYKEKNKLIENKEIEIKECTIREKDIDSKSRANLSPEEVRRYLRQIIIPEIRGEGQEKLLNSKIFIKAKKVEMISLLLFYCAAMGIGEIYYNTDDENNSLEKSIINHAKDINPELKIEKSSGVENLDIEIFFGSPNYIEKLIDNKKTETNNKIYAVIGNWKGFITSKMPSKNITSEINSKEIIKEGLVLSSSFSSSFAATQVIKKIIGFGEISEKPYYFNLWNMSFGEQINLQVNDKNKKQNLNNKSCLIVGCGGLGTPAAFILSQLGIGKLGLVDDDTVELSNLNRQILHSTSKIGKEKVFSAKKNLEKLFPAVKVNSYNTRFNEKNSSDLLESYDIVIDGLDNLNTRYILNDKIQKTNIPYIHAGALALYGQVTTIIPNRTPCFECIFPENIRNTRALSCSETGILGPVTGLMASIQVAEALKILNSNKGSLEGKLLFVDLTINYIQKMEIELDKNCKYKDE
ncbi:MAG: ThiF family adenylyltransferase [Tissierellales bacterium]|nr:ThiF family adenylyltransferase [Tissierellales bacterium]